MNLNGKNNDIDDAVSSTEILLGYPVSVHTVQEIANYVIEYQGNPRPLVINTINAHSYIKTRTDEEFASALKGSDILIADGVSFRLASLLEGNSSISRITGYDMFHCLMEMAEISGNKSVFFLGSSQNTLGKISAKVRRDFPNIEVKGLISPPFTDELTDDQNMLIIDEINTKCPDILWVAMTAPKQEKWAKKFSHELNCSAIVSIGAVFDFYAETKMRAPEVVRLIGLEWLWRFCVEPTRLWERALISVPLFTTILVYRFVTKLLR